MQRSGLWSMACLLQAWCLWGIVATALFAEAPTGKNVEFGQQVRPLLSDRCFACHGPDEKQRAGGFRLDLREQAFGTGESGETLIVPGNPGQSELYRRVTTSDESLRMPPAKDHPPLSPEEIQLLADWITQGAQWEEHWAYQPITKPELPQVARMEWPTTPVDHFILARLEREGLTPQAPADKATLLRRVHLDLTGLPPGQAELDSFLADTAPDAYEKVVDRLLQSPRYGEHMARYWLDAVRYGDTHGLHLDNYREMWPYRDWVVQAFNQNMPYDQFVREQLAGDLLENPTREQLIASGYNRCNVTTSEGGSIAEEVFVRNVVDRVVTFGTVMLGATLDCSRCHHHKFDPYTMRDFYSLFAYFNSIDGGPLDGNRKDHAPVIKVPTPEQERELRQFDEQLAELNRGLAELNPRLAGLQEAWEASVREAQSTAGETSAGWHVLVPMKFTSQGGATLTLKEDHSLLASGDNAARDVYEISGELPAGTLWKSIRLEGLLDPSLTTGAAGRSPNGNVVLTEFEVYVAPADQPEAWQRVTLSQAWADYEQANGDFKVANAIDGKPQTGWAIGGHERKENRQAIFQTASGIPGENGGLIKLVLKHESIYAQHQFGRIRLSLNAAHAIPQTLPAEILKLIAIPAGDRDAKQKQTLRAHFLDKITTDQEYLARKKERDSWQTKRDELDKQIPTTLIFKEKAEPKPAFLLHRGEYDQPREEVTRRTPELLGPFASEWPNNRLGLAYWVTSPDNRVAARVVVNRFWQQVFGTGLVRTSEDFGSQGSPPSHPLLLDWLARDFMDSGWNIKQFMKQLVLSSTYRQSSAVSPALHARDPMNRLLARGPRYRLDAEVLRDQALFVSGLLQESLGGPGVKPPQPAGLWEAVGYTSSNTARFTPDTGADKIHRRSLYTFIKRTSPPPQLGTFDGPSRESSCVRRERTNTPMQALLLFNDPQYLECALGLALRALREAGTSEEQTVSWMFRQCTGRLPTSAERDVLLQGVRGDLAYYRDQPEQAGALLKSCQLELKLGENDPPPDQLAAWTVTANILLTMDLTLNKN